MKKTLALLVTFLVALAAVACGDEGGSCVGTASSCSGRRGGSCGTQQGCIYTNRDYLSGSYNYVCQGTPTSCAEMTNEASCGKQQGCSWE